ncbi:molybdopterin-synthase adenylyltransferase MoeB [Fulvivirgaceae bacterium PWU4]|uniref:Molybdopterin-synthase adenylyltransferase n=1 Tax=Chryseosolibacter histidini TaxID=2782349 RepID=A0AAP2GIA4_9BACT|nr:molybdopterin-synthase adenylyltransferase MoeB [Chryseosolibacter histidini]MBT1696894.1 molybdopterin-synthase adenylyltransferase MoeB [Chryseosolibacter histidini]
MSLTSEELKRYSRHLVLQEFGMAGQLKLKHARVLVVGAGGLGSPVLLYLTAAGIGTIGIADHDTIDISNLQRQVLFITASAGESKALAAEKRLQQLNPLVSFRVHPVKLTSQNALDILKDYDVVVDGTDNFATRYLLNDACVLLDKPLVYGSILKFEGHLAVFNCPKSDGSRSPNYRDLFPEPPAPGSVQNCEDAGVIGVLPGIIGTMQANEVIKIVTGTGEPLAGKLLIFDSNSMEQTLITVPGRNSRNAIKTLIDYDDFCGISPDKNKSLDVKQTQNMKEITVQELKKLKDSGADFQLIDVREPHEYDICNLEGELIPMSEIPYNVDKISKDKQVVIHCRSGKRSGDMLLWLEKNHGFSNLYNLKGGVLAWAKEIDPTFPTY